MPYNSQSQQGVLTLYQVTTEMSGIYVCSSGSSQAQAQVIVQPKYVAPPTAKIEPKRLDLAQGEQGSLRCSIEGAQEAKWSKVSGEINPQTTTIRGTELYFFNVEVEDRGVYICGNLVYIFLKICFSQFPHISQFFRSKGVENESGVSRDSAILEVERREPPQIEVHPSDNQTVNVGEHVLFQCRVLSGIPNPDIEWKPLREHS